MSLAGARRPRTAAPGAERAPSYPAGSASPGAPLPGGLRRARFERSIGAMALAGLVALSLLVVAMAAERPSLLTPTSRPGYFPGWMAGPLRGLWPSLTRHYDTLAWQASALMGAMFLLYLLAYAGARQLRGRWIVLAILAIHLIFLLAPPLSYTDVFNYINYGRMDVVHGLNPYTVIPQLEPHSDPSFGPSNWHFLLSPYGPLFTLITEALVPLGVVASFWALKALVGLASLATLALVWRCAAILRRPAGPAVVFVGCNPIFLVWGLGADHNDSLMLLGVMICVYLLLRSPRRPREAGMALIAALFVKASAAILLPVMLLATAPGRFLRGALEAALVLGLSSALAFGPHIPGLSTQSRLVTGLGLPNLLGLALGLGGETRGLHAAIAALVLLVLAVCMFRVRKHPGDWLAACGTVLLVLIASLSWAAPWYLVWALPFAALLAGRRLRIAAVVLGAYFILAFAPAVPMLAHAIHLNPEATALGRHHRREIEALVQ